MYIVDNSQGSKFNIGHILNIKFNLRIELISTSKRRKVNIRNYTSESLIQKSFSIIFIFDSMKKFQLLLPLLIPNESNYIEF